MGWKTHKELIVLICCFALTATLVYKRPETGAAHYPVSLSRALSNIKGWKKDYDTIIDPKIVEALKLDDYVNSYYTNGTKGVFLYIGYYYTAGKIGAAHDPMVCFPGQGWIVSDSETGQLTINGNSDEEINYSSFVTQRGEDKNLAIYWFQSHDRTNESTLLQKVSLAWKKLTGKGEANAFVRITAAVDDKSFTSTRKAIFEFIQEFYPVFLDYIKSNQI